MFEMSIWTNTKPSLDLCDIVIEPKGLSRYNIFSFNKTKELFELGYNATLDVIPQIKNAIKKS